MTWWKAGLVSAALAGSLVAGGGEARACGGCFAPPGAAQVVTDHRMVLSLSSTQTTLWDQFQYSGSPEEFSWILPIRYTDSTRVELASDDFLTLLTNVLVPAMNQPAPPPLPPGCSPPWNSGWGGAVDASAPSQDAAAADAGVVVLRQEVVGPYAVAIVRGATGMGLRDWLRMNGYTVPTAVEPVIDHYLGLGMDFIALRLRAGKGLNRMAPVRVTLDGYQPRLPLRMIAAGVADRVGLSLTVIAESRVEAMNFPNAQFTDDDFTYDWNRPPGDLGRVFLDAFNARNRAMGDRLWLTESAMRVDWENLAFLAARLPQRMGFGPDGGTGDGGAGASAVADVGVAFMGVGANAVATRLRADLPARMLDRDLDLAASDLGLRDRTYQFGHELNRPMYSVCPWPVDGGSGEVPRDASAADAGSPDGAGPPDDVGSPDAAFDGGAPADAVTAGPTPAVSSGGLQCATSRPAGSSPDGAALAAGVVALALCLRRARRAR
ncbi:MAG: DUF2330 domain-containing protein [Polyangiales bacterium]